VTAIPVLALITAAVGLGLFVGLLYLRHVRRPVLIAFHFLLGAIGTEGFVQFLHGPSSRGANRAGAFGDLALVLFIATLLSGLIASLLVRGAPRSSKFVLATHAGVGLVGFGILVTWFATLQ